MGKDSKIEWTDHTFNPWMGCTKVDSGCLNCYAERDMDHRFGKVKWGPQGSRLRTSEKYWHQPYRWDAEAKASGKRVKVFCASLADVFERYSIEMAQWRNDLWRLIADTPHLTWMLLTKRAHLVGSMVPMTWMQGHWPYHVWIGTSVSNQDDADKRVPQLLEIPARVHFVSAEPLLGAVQFREDWLLSCKDCGNQGSTALFGRAEPGAGLALCRDACKGEEGPSIDWIIAGGESGPNARPTHPQWARDIRDQCQDAGVPFHFKQWGEWWPISQGCGSFIDDLAQPPPLRVLQLDGQFVDEFNPHDEGLEGIIRVGRKQAGRLLDGEEWNGEPR